MKQENPMGILRVCLVSALLSIFSTTAYADLGFSCSGDPSDWNFHKGQYNPLSNSDFGTKSYSDKPKIITDCDLFALVLINKITEADHKGLKIFANTYPKTLVQKVLYIKSSGGDMLAAIKIAKFIRKKGLKVFTIGPCYSSCVIVLAGGIWRQVSGNSEIGIHRPYATETTSNLSEDLVIKKFAENTKILKNTFRELRIPEELADKMMSVSPLDIKILTNDEISYFGLGSTDPVHETRQNNLNAIKRGLSLQEYIRRSQLHFQSAAKCRQENVALSREWLLCGMGGEKSEKYERAKTICPPIHTDGSEIDYERYMEQREHHSKCFGEIMRSN